MAYVPPHRRKKDGSEKKEYFYPDADVETEKFAYRIWCALDANGNSPPNLKLSFKPFEDTSIPHLRDTRVFTLSVDDAENDMRSLVNSETPPWKYTSNRIKNDLRKCFQKLESRAKRSKPNYAKPAFTARFGKITFHGSRISWHESFTLENLEKIFNVERDSPKPSRTFDTNIPRDIFEAIKQKAIMNLASPTVKEKIVYLILARDDLNPNVSIMVTCRKKEIDVKQIELNKIELLNLKHFLADTSCLNKVLDWRLSATEKYLIDLDIELLNLKHFLADTSCLNKVLDWRLSATEKYLIDLDEEDKECIEGIVKSARCEVGAKGGLMWPPGYLVRKRNRFHVTAVWNLNVTTIVGETWDIKFQLADRVNFANFANTEIEYNWRVSNEIDLKLKSISKYLRERRPWEEENIMNILEDNLKWVWLEALS